MERQIWKSWEISPKNKNVVLLWLITSPEGFKDAMCEF